MLQQVGPFGPTDHSDLGELDRDVGQRSVPLDMQTLDAHRVTATGETISGLSRVRSPSVGTALTSRPALRNTLGKIPGLGFSVDALETSVRLPEVVATVIAMKLGVEQKSPGCRRNKPSSG